MDPQRGPLRQEVLTWADIDELMDVLVPQLRDAGVFDVVLAITRGGIIPSGMIAEALDIRWVLMAAVRFPTDLDARPLAVWPEFWQFPEEALLERRRALIVDDVWGSGRTITAVRGRVEAAGGRPATCVFHFNPYRSLFSKAEPDYYGAITDAYIVYPWEIDRDIRGIPATKPRSN